MIERFISEVPRRIWGEKAPHRSRFGEAEFNVASWIRFEHSRGPLKLMIHHEDEAGEHLEVVDSTGAPGDGNALLSGVVRVRFTGKVKAMRVLLGVSDPEVIWSVDELYVQRRGTPVARENKLISGF